MHARWIVGVLLWSSVAAAADPPPSTAAVKQLAVVSGTTCALHADGGVSCWGRELDRSPTTKTIHARPISVTSFGTGVEQLEGVFFGICARYRDRTVKCLGMLPSSTDVPELQPLTDIVDLRGTCARSGDGHVSCFDSKVWSRVSGLDDAIDAHGGDLTGCAVHKDATVSCRSAKSTRPHLGRLEEPPRDHPDRRGVVSRELRRERRSGRDRPCRLACPPRDDTPGWKILAGAPILASRRAKFASACGTRGG